MKRIHAIFLSLFFIATNAPGILAEPAQTGKSKLIIKPPRTSAEAPNANSSALTTFLSIFKYHKLATTYKHRRTPTPEKDEMILPKFDLLRVSSATIPDTTPPLSPRPPMLPSPSLTPSELGSVSTTEFSESSDSDESISDETVFNNRSFLSLTSIKDDSSSQTDDTASVEIETKSEGQID